MTVKQKQNLLAFLGLYTGAIDGIWGGGSKAATRTVQEKAGLPVTGEIDQTTAGVIAEAITAKIVDAFTVTEAEPETDSVWDGIKYFTPDEFACKCNRYCDGFPEQISRNLLVLLDGVREHYGVPITISSGVRCQRPTTQTLEVSTTAGTCRARPLTSACVVNLPTPWFPICRPSPVCGILMPLTAAGFMLTLNKGASDELHPLR